MALLAIFPAIAWIVIAAFAPQWLPALPYSPAIVCSTVLALLLLVTLFFRQWHWAYWVAWLAGTSLTLLLTPASAGLYQAMPIWLTLSALMLAFAPLPALLSGRGYLLFLALLALPLLMLDAKVSTTLALANPTKLLSLPNWPYGFELAVLGIASVWATYLLYRGATAYRWAQWSAWVILMSFFKPNGSALALEWTLIAAVAAFLIALADQLLRLAYIDELTGLPQRRALMSQLQHLRKRSAICMLDVDHFKTFNDRYGHDVGDQVLRLLGSILSRTRGVNAYRYGGEEFTLVFQHNDSALLKKKLEEVRQKVANYPLKLRDDSRPTGKSGKQSRGKNSASKQVKVTISLGATLREKHDTPETLLKRADENLYAAKKSGRNKVVLK